MKKRVLITFVEAGQGHIVTAEAIANGLEKLYGDSVEVIRDYIFRDSGDKDLIKYEKFLVKEVKRSNKNPLHLGFQCVAMKLFTEVGTLNFTYNTVFRKVKNKIIKHFEEINPDVIVSTHFCPSHFAACAKKKGKLQNTKIVTYDPDPNVHGWWTREGDLFITNNDKATEEAISKKHFKKETVKQVNFITRESVVNTTESKDFYREKYGFPKDNFTVVLADGAYASANLERFTDELLKSNINLTIVPIAGKNEKVLAKYNSLKDKTKPNIVLRPFPFVSDVQEIYKAADLFITKAGPNAILDSIFMGTPVLTNFYSGPIEKATNDLFVNHYKVGLFCKDAKKAKLLVEDFANNKEKLKPYIENTKHFNPQQNGADEIAKIIAEL
ncbi:MAG: hypothetical protein MSA34_03500 [Firmicutes bacterium]|nr:hypothetical protein [Bacillota bacterium]MDY5586083.1 glycosyltransferase [Eubacteriales bacterium]